MLVQYLTATPEYKHHTYSISVADGANMFLSIFEVASSLGLKVSTSVATQGGIKFVSRCSVESPHTNKVLHSAMSEGKWIILVDPEIKANDGCKVLLFFFQKCENANTIHQDFKLILVFGFNRNYSKAQKALIARTQRFMLQPVHNVNQYILELCNHQDWSHLSTEDRVIQFTIGYCAGMMQERTSNGTILQSSFYKIHDAHYFRIIYLLDDELFQAAVSRIITISKKERTQRMESCS